MKKTYVLQSLESLLQDITIPSLQERTAEQTAHMIQTIVNEKVKVYQYLKAEIFNLKDEGQTRLKVRKYHHAIILMINHAFNLQKKNKDKDSSSMEILAYLLISLEEMQQFLEVSYPEFLGKDKRVGLPELAALKIEIEEKIPLLPPILQAGNNSEKSIEIAIDAFKQFSKRIEHQEPIILDEYEYHKMLLNDLVTRGDQQLLLQDCPTLHELLLYWNFNSPESISYFTMGLETLIAECLTPQAKLEFMRFQFKRLLGIPVKHQTIYNKNFPSMKSHFCGWLKNEIDYLEQKMEGFSPLLDSHLKVKEKITPVKVLVSLTANQIGLLLRACKEKGILISKSIEAVFKTIIPFISTNNKEELSPKTMVGKLYATGDRDIHVVATALKDLARHVEDYKNR